MLLLRQFDRVLEDKKIGLYIQQGLAFIGDISAFCFKGFQAGIFGGLFFLAVFLMPREGIFNIPRYDTLLMIALGIQLWLIRCGIESLSEARTILVFHLCGFCLEVFKVSAGIKSWEYPDFAYSKVFGVPLFAGFMYAAVGSYMIMSWKLLKVNIHNHPPYWISLLLGLLLYLNFFTHHYILDCRWYLAAFTAGLYCRSTIFFYPREQSRRIPLLLAFIFVGFFVWVAENLATYLGLWRYPNQIGIWTAVQFEKWPAWTLLTILSFSIITSIDQVKKNIHFMS